MPKQLCRHMNLTMFCRPHVQQDPERVVYRELQLNAGTQYFFSRESWEGVKGIDPQRMKDVLSRYSFIK